MIAIVKAFTTSSRYGVPQSISPLQTIDIPEQGSGFLIPPELVLSRSLALNQASITTSDYGVPIAPVAPVRPIAPLQTIDLPEQGPGFLVPPQSRDAPQQVTSNSYNSAPITTSDYGVPIAPVAPVRPIAPLQTIDLPEQGPGFLVPPQSRDAPQQVTSNSYNSAPITTSDYGVPIAPVAPVKPIAPLQTIDLPEQGPGFLVPPQGRNDLEYGKWYKSDYGVPIAPEAPVAPVKPIAPLQTIDLPEQGPGFLVPPQSRDSGRLGKSNSDYSAPISSIAPVAPISPLETIDLPEQGAGFLESPTSRSEISTTSNNLGKPLTIAPLETNVSHEQNPGIVVSPSGRYGFQSSDYSVPVAPLLPIEPAPITPVAPLETIDLPEQGAGILLPPSSRSSDYWNSYYASHVAPIAPVKSDAPLETIALPKQGSGFLVTPSSRSGFQPIASTYNDYTIPIAPIAPPITPLETIDIPEQGAGFVVPPSNRFNPNLGTATNDPVFKSSSTPFATILPIAPAASIAPAEPFQSEILYSYQVQDGSSFRQEMRETNGLTRGFYSYVDPNGILQRVDYISDPLNGYQVLSEPIIKDTPEVAQAKADFFKAYNAALGVHLK